MFAAQGMDLDRSTLAFWAGYTAAELAPLYHRLKQILLGSAKLAVDETPVPALYPRAPVSAGRNALAFAIGNVSTRARREAQRPNAEIAQNFDQLRNGHKRDE
jgi:hypothetical protein